MKYISILLFFGSERTVFLRLFQNLEFYLFFFDPYLAMSMFQIVDGAIVLIITIRVIATTEKYLY